MIVFLWHLSWVDRSVNYTSYCTVCLAGCSDTDRDLTETQSRLRARGLICCSETSIQRSKDMCVNDVNVTYCLDVADHTPNAPSHICSHTRVHFHLWKPQKERERERLYDHCALLRFIKHYLLCGRDRESFTRFNTMKRRLLSHSEFDTGTSDRQQVWRNCLYTYQTLLKLGDFHNKRTILQSWQWYLQTSN